MKKCFIFAGGDFDGFYEKINEDDLVIGADKGYQYALAENIPLDYIIGDFDSADEPEGDNITVLNPVKDFTDTVAAIELAKEKGYKEIIIYGGLGRRESHTIANIRSMYFYKNQGLDISLRARGKKIFIVDDIFTYKHKGKDFYVSIFSLRDISRGLTIKNLYYELDNYDLAMDSSLGVSNETCGKDFSIEVKDGVLLVIFEDFSS
ncbi:MAG: thiamine diphosphokinase [Anaerococcus sp.]|nr:thiamine diphosphokinase [Anaerococcus sp.]MDY2919544.1 thiamine diphosphokinase [Anaerococcus sp.]